MKFLLIASLFWLVSCLPQERGRSAAVEQQRLQPALCAVAFESGMKLPEIAERARLMKTQCRMTDGEILKKARQVFY